MSQFFYGKKVKCISSAALLLAVLVGLAGCGGNSDNENLNVSVGTGTGDPIADTGKTISATMGAAFQGTSSGITNSSQTIQCNPDGQAIVAGDASTGNPATFDLTADFNNCAGLDGSIEMSGEVFSNQTDLNYNFTVSGIVGGNGCALDIDDFGANISQIGDTLTFLLSGSISATCGSATVICDYNGVNSQDTSALQAACNCSGAGC